MNRRVVFVAALLSSGCFHPPEIVLVDRATALEQEASGSFGDVEARLNRAAIEPRPVPLTAEQLAALGVAPSPIVDGGLTDADRLDGLLVQHCVGEGNDGFVVDTPDACHGAADPDEVRTLVERLNRSRRQLFRWMHEQRPAVSVDEMRRSWRAVHAAGIVCGGWVETDDGKWQGKAC